MYFSIYLACCIAILIIVLVYRYRKEPVTSFPTKDGSTPTANAIAII
jgi:hypothetical protein